MPIHVIDSTTDQPPPCSKDIFIKAAETALLAPYQQHEVSICMVDEKEMQRLNKTFRHKDKSTNVLAFPVEHKADENSMMPLYLGDIAICNAVATAEAAQKNISLQAHMSHLVIHAMLHLQKYDHENEEEAAIMQEKEIELLQQLGYANPYLE